MPKNVPTIVPTPEGRKGGTYLGVPKLCQAKYHPEPRKTKGVGEDPRMGLVPCPGPHLARFRLWKFQMRIIYVKR